MSMAIVSNVAAAPAVAQAPTAAAVVDTAPADVQVPRFAPLWLAQQQGLVQAALGDGAPTLAQGAQPEPAQPEPAQPEPADSGLLALAPWLQPVQVDMPPRVTPDVTVAQQPVSSAAQRPVSTVTPPPVSSVVPASVPPAALTPVRASAPQADPARDAGVIAGAATVEHPAGAFAALLQVQAKGALQGGGQTLSQGAFEPPAGMRGVLSAPGEMGAGPALAAQSAQAPAVAADVTAVQAMQAPASARPVVQPLVQMLAQRIELQQAQGLDVATVRLDPPDLGSLEIRIQQQAGGVQVVLHASHAEVGRQLAAMAEGLRQELQSRSGADATVTVAQHSRQGASADQQERRHSAWQAQESIGQALQGEAEQA